MKSKSLDMLQHKYSVGMWGNQDENEKNKNDFCQLLVEMFKYFFFPETFNNEEFIYCLWSSICI